jgi:hypothetical protein
MLSAGATWGIRRSSSCGDLSCRRSRWLVNRVLNAASHSRIIIQLLHQLFHFNRVGHNLQDTLFTERAFQYVDKLPNVIFLITQNVYPKVLVEDAWWMVMLRRQCWEMSVNRVVQKSCVPSSYYNSPTKVYIL